MMLNGSGCWAAVDNKTVIEDEYDSEMNECGR